MKKFNKSYTKRVEGIMLDGLDTKIYTYSRIYILDNCQLEVWEKNVSVSIDNKEIAIFAFGDNVLDDFILLEIANNILNHPNREMAFQNSISKECGYLKISNEYFLVDCDPTDETEKE